MKKETMGDRIEQLRAAYSLKQSEFAKKINVSPLTVGNIIRGETRSFQPETLSTIIDVFGTTREWLETGTGKMLPNGKIDSKKESNPWREEAYNMR